MARLPDLSSDRAFYYAVGLFTIALFVGGLVLLALTSPDGVGSRELVGFVVGFSLFMLAYFVSMTIYRLVPS